MTAHRARAGRRDGGGPGLRRAACTGATLLALLLGSRAAPAQVLDGYFTPIPRAVGGEGADRSRSETLARYDAPGVRLGTFLVRPDLGQSFGYNTNAEGRADGRGSLLLRSQGAVTATSDWSRNSAFLQVALDDRRYLDLPRQSYTDWAARLAATVDVGRDAATFAYSHVNQAQTPGSIDAVTFIEPVPLRVDSARLSYAATGLGRFTLVPEVRVTSYDHDDFKAGAATISQAYRDRVALQPGLTVRYGFAPGRDALLVVQGTHLLYRTGSAGLPRRDSDGVAVLGGLDYPAPGSNVRFRVLAGVQTRQYRSRAYAGQTAPIIEASATWTPTRLTTLTLTARRDIEDAADETIAGYTLTALRLSADHELRRDVLLNAFAELRQAEFQSARISAAAATVSEAGRSQTLYSAGAGATWLLNRNVRLGVSYALTARRDSRPNSDYLSNTGLLSLGLRL